MASRGVALAWGILAMAVASSCFAEGRVAGKAKKNPPPPPQEKSDDPPRSGKAGSDEGVVFFPPGAIDLLKAKSAKFEPIRVRLDQSVQHARKQMGERPNSLANAELDGKGRPKSETRELISEFDLILDFAVANVMTGDKAFLDKADEFLTAWAANYKADGNPIDEYHFTTFIMAYELVRDRLPAASREKVGRMLLDLYDAEVRFVSRGKGFERYGNWVSHHVTLCAAIAFLRKDPEQIAYVEKMYRGQLSNNILDHCRFSDFVHSHFQKLTKEIDQAPNLEVERGSTFDFVHRDALSYHIESLMALYVAATIAKNSGQAWFTLQGDDGQSLWWGFDFLVPYATGAKKHYEFDKSLHPPDHKSKEKRWFNPETGLAALTVASAVHAEYKKYRDVNLLKTDEGWLMFAIGTPPDEL
jgi:alginate lyase